jgi:uncharacterized protein YjdB
MNKKILSVVVAALTTISMIAPTTAFAATTADQTATTSMGVSYSAHVQHIGWQSAVTNGAEAGTDGKSLRMEALKINLTNAPAGASISYQAHVQSIGWQSVVSNGAEAGTDGRSLRMEAIKMTLTGAPGYELEYRAHVQSIGWQSWQVVANGTDISAAPIAGTTGKSLRMEAIEIQVVPLVASISAVNSSVAVGGTTGFTFKDSTGAAVTPSNVTYSVTSSNASTAFFNNGVFTATAAGTYTVAANVGGTTVSTNVNVYGVAAAVKLSAASSSIIANGSSTDVITATVVDANGNTVANYNGNVNVYVSADTYSNFGISDDVAQTSGTATITNGVGTITMNSTSDAGSFTVYTSGLNSTTSAVSTNITYGTLSLSTTAPGASALSLSAAEPDVSTNNANVGDVITATVNDASGVEYTTGYYYVTFTVTGPASFTANTTAATATTSTSVYTSGGTAAVTVYPIVGENGTVTITATASGVTAATTTIQAVQTTTPSRITLTSKTGTLTSAFSTYAVGTPYTEYTATLVDSNGNAVLPTESDNLKISDNVVSLNDGGTLNYYTSNSGTPDLRYTSTSNTYFNYNLDSTPTSTYSFYVFNTAVGSVAPTITVYDPSTVTSATAGYNYSTTSATEVAFVNAYSDSSTVYTGSAAPNTTVTYTAQLEDASGNALNVAGQQVEFYLGLGANDETNPDVTINGYTGVTPYYATTDANGKASVTVAYGSAWGTDAGYGTTIALSSKIPSNSTTSVLTVSYQAAGSYAYSVGLSSTLANSGYTAITWPTSVDASTSAIDASALGLSGTVYVQALNYFSGPLTSDEINISSSNSSVLDVAAIPDTTSTNTSNSALSAWGIVPKSAGTATLTFKDVTNPATPVLTETLTVNASTQPTLIKALNPDGTYDTNYSFTTSNVTNGVSQAFTLQLTDDGGNLVPANAPVTLTLAEVEALCGIVPTNTVTGMRTAAGGSDSSTITIPAGQATFNVYLDGITTGTATNAYTTTALSTINDLASETVSGTTITLTFNNPLISKIATDLNDAFNVTIATGSDATASDAVTNVAVNGDTVTLTVTNSIKTGTSTTVAFTPSTLASIETIYGASIPKSYSAVNAK